MVASVSLPSSFGASGASDAYVDGQQNSLLRTKFRTLAADIRDKRDALFLKGVYPGIFNMEAWDERREVTIAVQRAYEKALEEVDRVRLKRAEQGMEFLREKAEREMSIVNARNEVDAAIETQRQNISTVYQASTAGLRFWNVGSWFSAVWQYQKSMWGLRASLVRDPSWVRVRRIRNVRRAELRLAAADFQANDFKAKVLENDMAFDARSQYDELMTPIYAARREALKETGKTTGRFTLSLAAGAFDVMGWVAGHVSGGVAAVGHFIKKAGSLSRPSKTGASPVAELAV